LTKPQGEKYPDAEPQRQLTEFEKTIVKALREKKGFHKDTDEEVATLIAPVLGWSAKERKASIAHYLEMVEREKVAFCSLQTN
jgi:hypothetical protein